MFINKFYLLKCILLVSLIITSCIEEFTPEFDDIEDILVINGSIIKGDSIQSISITRSKPYNETNIYYVSNCIVWVENETGEEFYFEESNIGIYNAVIPQQFLNINSKFKLRVRTEDGNDYESTFETILESSPIDSIYYIEESYQSSSDDYNNGLQFYLDLKAPEELSKYYKWKLEETWEYHTHLIYGQVIFSVIYEVEPFDPPIDSLSKCWNTRNVKGLFTSSTENLIVNEKKRIPLNYIPGINSRLNYRYSLLVKQYAISEELYKYWDEHRTAISESGGLYQKQPNQSKSNIYNMNDPDELILGYFWTASFSKERIFFNGPFNNNIYTCFIDTILSEQLQGMLGDYVSFIGWLDTVPLWGKAQHSCFDCRLQGGTTTKPDFWED